MELMDAPQINVDDDPVVLNRSEFAVLFTFINLYEPIYHPIIPVREVSDAVQNYYSDT